MSILRKRLWVVVLTACVLAGATAAYSLVAQPVFRSTASLLIDPSVRQPFDNPNVATRGIDESSFIDSQVAVIGSDTVLRPVVRQFNLAADSEFGAQTDTGGWSLLSLFRGGGDTGTPASEIKRENDALKAFMKAVKVSRVGLTHVVVISAESASSEKAASLAQAIAESYLADLRRQKLASAAGINEQVEKRLIDLRQRMRDAEAAVQDYKAANRLQSTGNDGLLTSQELAGLNTQLTEARAALAERQARYDELATFISRGISANSINEISTSTTVTQLRDQYTTAARTVANLEAELLPQHPRLIRAKSELRRIEALLRAEAQDAADAARVELGVAKERVVNLESAVDRSRARTNVGDTAMIRLRELETEAQTTRSLYENLSSRAKEISALDEVVVPTARIIAPALPMNDPVWPKKKLLVALAGILGVLLGVLLAVGGEAIRQVSARIGPRLAETGPQPASAERHAEPVDDVPLVAEAPETPAPAQPAAPEKPALAQRPGGFSLLNIQAGAK